MRLMPQRRIGRTEVKGAALSEPPPVLETHFQAVDTTDKEEIQRDFVSFVQDLHLFLNETSCLRDIQVIRRERKPGITNLDTGTHTTPAAVTRRSSTLGFPPTTCAWDWASN